MASWREIDRIRKDPRGFRELAARLLALTDADMTGWETAFLDDVVRKIDVKEYSTRQSEKLLQIRDDAESIETVRGFSVKLLIDGCYIGRLDLSEDDERWLIAVRKQSLTTIKRKHAGRLMHCASVLGLVEELGDA